MSIFNYNTAKWRQLGIGTRIESWHYIMWGDSCSLPGTIDKAEGLIGSVVTEGDDFVVLEALPGNDWFKSQTLPVSSPTARPVSEAHPDGGEELQRVAALPAERSHIPQGDKERKDAPMYRGLIGYFPAALFAVAAHSMTSDRKHNPGNVDGPHWNRGASDDHEDCIIRHACDLEAPGTPGRAKELTAIAWRALAALQKELELHGAKPGVSARFKKEAA